MNANTISLRQINSAISGVEKSGHGFVGKTNDAIVLVFEHLRQHGDTSHVNRLVETVHTTLNSPKDAEYICTIFCEYAAMRAKKPDDADKSAAKVLSFKRVRKGEERKWKDTLAADLSAASNSFRKLAHDLTGAGNVTTKATPSQRINGLRTRTEKLKDNDDLSGYPDAVHRHLASAMASFELARKVAEKHEKAEDKPAKRQRKPRKAKAEPKAETKRETVEVPAAA